MTRPRINADWGRGTLGMHTSNHPTVVRNFFLTRFSLLVRHKLAAAESCVLLHLGHRFPVTYRTSPHFLVKQKKFHLQVPSYLKQRIISSYSCGHREKVEISFFFSLIIAHIEQVISATLMTQDSLHNFSLLSPFPSSLGIGSVSYSGLALLQ